MRQFVFSDGTKIPAGEVIGVPSGAIHTDPTVYEDPNKFDAFRFSRTREREGENAKHHATNTSLEFLTFGHGKHAW
jgi:cytochrome P450